ncbi:amino acid aminotransferase [Chitinasiproducens palmae]|uniref:Aminotransferase n=1 Tax=Chitinasiproducens palmae TaxID=1770053 RepID=A0A1H2PJ94_9BURK|nr:amino acid aminotransferase [Chitinasiproducens palmae]SDV46383.1 aromatic-amino-acid transaminase [Chitinasiproducens palmae]
MFERVDAYPGDPILGLMEAYSKDPRPTKAALSIGLYYDENGDVPLLASVKEAERIAQAQALPRLYLPMEGSPAYRKGVQQLVFGADHKALAEGRVATIQSIGGSGALKVGADFLKRYFPDSQVWVSDPTWDNHTALFQGAGFTVNTYPYYDAASNGLRFDAMLDTLSGLPAQSIVLLHPCCHNPTGIDLNREQWSRVIEVVKARELLPFMDMAYQGFGDGLAEDAWPIRAMADAGVVFLAANSFSKNLSLYGERVGGLSVVCEDAESAGRVLGQLKSSVRRNYSSPVLHGSEVVAAVLGDARLFAMWEKEVAAMRERIKAMRERLHAVLSQKVPDGDFSYILTQRGMFSYTGLSAEQVDTLREAYGVYLVRSGRICVAGLNEGNIEYVANCFAEVLKK